MSRAFLKNETADDPVVIPARAPLPPGVTNYVTPRGLALLRTELAELETERAQVQANESDETERSRHLAELNGRIANLNQRIASARVVDSHTHPQGPDDQPVVRFGVTVTLRLKQSSDRTEAIKNAKSTGRLSDVSVQNKDSSNERRLTIVGVDEADVTQGLIAFTAPIARAMQGKRIGDVVSLRTARGEELLEIMKIEFIDS